LSKSESGNQIRNPNAKSLGDSKKIVQRRRFNATLDSPNKHRGEVGVLSRPMLERAFERVSRVTSGRVTAFRQRRPAALKGHAGQLIQGNGDFHN
jgi:hypothetical protein